MKLRELVEALYDPSLAENMSVADLLDLEVRFHTSTTSNLECASTYICTDAADNLVYNIDLE